MKNNQSEMEFPKKYFDLEFDQKVDKLPELEEPRKVFQQLPHSKSNMDIKFVENFAQEVS
jgi:hypothetical protein